MSRMACICRALLVIVAVVTAVGLVTEASAQSAVPWVTLEMGGGDSEPERTAATLQVVAMLTVLSLAPALLVMMTSFTRIIVVLSFVRSALAMQQMPPNQVLIGLALFLTVFVMAPVWSEVNEQALQPYLAEELAQAEALDRAMVPIRAFMLGQTREKDLGLFMSLGRMDPPDSVADVPTFALIPAFAISELRTAFEIGFLMFIPFIIIDMVVASTLMSMGMLMLPPMMISLPFKILLFVLVDGWHMVIRSVVTSFR